MPSVLVVDETGQRWSDVRPGFEAPPADVERVWLIDGTASPPLVRRGGATHKLSMDDVIALGRCILFRKSWEPRHLYPSAATMKAARRRFEQARLRVEGPKARGAHALRTVQTSTLLEYRFSPGPELKYCLLLARDDALALGVDPPAERGSRDVEPRPPNATVGASGSVGLRLKVAWAVCLRDGPQILVRVAILSSAPALIVRFVLRVGAAQYPAVDYSPEELCGELPIRGRMLLVKPPGLVGNLVFMVGDVWGDPNWQNRSATLVAQAEGVADLECGVSISW